MERSFRIDTPSTTNLFVRHWPSGLARPQAVVLVQHGMAEHSGRYAAFAHYLNQHGLEVYANDHIGHGHTLGTPPQHGWLGPKNGWLRLLADTHALMQHIEQQHPECPILLFGHSMGSLVVRHYLQVYRHHRLRGAVLMATAQDPGLLRRAGQVLASILRLANGASSPSHLLNRLSFGKFNAAIEPRRTAFDWLSRDNDAVDAYIADPLCGGVFGAGFWTEFFWGIGQLSGPKAIARTQPDVPLLFVAGDHDPVGNFGKGVQQVAQAYRRHCPNPIGTRLFAGARHELLNEINHNEVFLYVQGWMQQQLTKPGTAQSL